jgi:anti-sigma factor RsiW/uncharacterized small protein (DUF1192 family)
MSRPEHPLWEEELMPYVDGQLEAAQATRIEEHLGTCASCATSVADARRLSQQMTAWTVEEPSEQLAEQVLSQVGFQRDIGGLQGFRLLWKRRPMLVYGLVGTIAASIMLAVVLRPGLLEPRLGVSGFVEDKQIAVAEQRSGSLDAITPVQSAQPGQNEQKIERRFAQSREVSPPPSEAASGPMIIRTARLRVVTKEFDGTRPRIEAIVQQSQGYLDQLTIRGEAGSGRTLSATLRLPSDRIDAGLNDLRKLGKVQEESQNSSDVTSQYVDLRARLTNARNTEQRLLRLLSERTGKLTDVVEVEREIARVREEIERMEAQQKDMTNKAQFATIQLEVSEEYHARLEPSVPSAGTRLQNALIHGYHAAAESLLVTTLLILSYGPTFLLWGALLTPVGLVLRRVHRARMG